MVMKNFYFLITLLMLTACCCKNSGNDLDSRISQHENKLRMHFMGVSRNEDISSLIQETRDIANQLREQGKPLYARRFDSYTDVLMFGNNTLAESIADVNKLVTKGPASSNCRCKSTSFCEVKDNLMKRFKIDA